MTDDAQRWDAATYERERLIWHAVLEGLHNSASTTILDQALSFTNQRDQPGVEWQLLFGVTASLFGKTLANLIGEREAADLLTSMLRTNEIDTIGLNVPEHDTPPEES